MLEKKITFDSFIRGVISGIVVISILYLVNILSGVLLPFFIAWLTAYLIYPFVTFFQYKLRLKNRPLSIFVVMILLSILIILFGVLLVPPIVEEFGKLKTLLTDHFIEGSKQAAIPGTIANFIKEHIDMLEIQRFFSEENLTNTLRSVLPKAWNILAQSVNVIVGIFASFIILLYTFFILLDYESIATGWTGLIPVKHRESVTRIVNDVKDGMNRYFRGQALVAFLVGILFSVGFLIIDFPLAVGFGAGTQIHRHVKHFAVYYAHQFILRVVNLKMKSPKYALFGSGLIVLHKLLRNSRFCKIIIIIGLDKITPFITENTGRDDFQSFDFTGFHTDFSH